MFYFYNTLINRTIAYKSFHCTQNVLTSKKITPKALYLSGFRGFCLSFPLDGAGGFGGDIVDDAVDVLNLVRDAV